MDSFGRTEYNLGTLDESNVPESPWTLFAEWIDAATRSNITEPLAMNLATCHPDGRPTGRMVLMRGWSEDGIRFFTNYLSRKGQDLDASPVAALTFWWGDLERQIRIEGTVGKLSSTESDEYFNARPIESRFASAASPQSQIIASREELEHLVEELRDSSNGEISRPDHWGGYALAPSYFEFWQGRPSRLHDRIVYQIGADSWQINRLAP